VLKVKLIETINHHSHAFSC